MSIYASELLRGKAALITGGSSEVGAGLAAAFAAAGADVALAYHANKEGASGLAGKLADSAGVRTAVFYHDLYDQASNRALPRQAAAHFGRLDFLVNNAGGGGLGSLRETTPAAWEEAFAGNLHGPFLLAREAALLMEQQGGGGCIVNLAATSAIKASHGAYGVAKAAVIALTGFLAHSFAPRVRVCCLVPGLMEIEDVNPELRRQRAAASPLKRNCTPADLGALAVACCSPAFAAVTGISLVVDGGFWLNHP